MVVRHPFIIRVWARNQSLCYSLALNRLTVWPQVLQNFHDQKSRLDYDRISSFNPINGHLAQHIYYQTHWDKNACDMCGWNPWRDAHCLPPTYSVHYPQENSLHVHGVGVDLGEMISKLGWVAIYQRIFEWGFLLMSFCLYSPYSRFYPLSHPNIYRWSLFHSQK